MPRIRSLKPEFFTDADLGELPALHRLLYAGLWTQADRDGRLEDRPRELKVRVLPYDDCNADEMLEELYRRGFIVRYAVEGQRLISIPKFAEHQKFHRDEKPHGYPPPPPDASTRCHQLPARGVTSEPESATNLAPPVSTPVNGKRTSDDLTSVDGDGATAVPAVAPAASSSKALLPLFVFEPPTKPVEEWTGNDFWVWFQSKRQKASFAPERAPNPRALGAWWTTATSFDPDVERLKAAVYAFGDDTYWQERGLPFAGFMDQWNKYLPRKEPRRA